MVKIMIVLTVPDELADADDRTGMTEEGYDELMQATNDLGWDIVSGPDRVAGR